MCVRSAGGDDTISLLGCHHADVAARGLDPDGFRQPFIG